MTRAACRELAQHLSRDFSHHTAIQLGQEDPMHLDERIGASPVIYEAEKNHSATALGQSIAVGHEQVVGE